MRVVLDTNVFVSGLFFSGPPHRILKAWRDGNIRLVISPEILDEYRRVAYVLASEFAGVSIDQFLALATVGSEIVFAPVLAEPVCSDPEDGKFIACALAGRCKIVVSGDKALLAVSGYAGVEVLSPRVFIRDYLEP